MPRNDSWIRVKIKNPKTGSVMCLYHPPRAGSAGQDVDRELRDILEIPSPRTKDYVPVVTIEALPSPADWLTAKVPVTEVPEGHCK